MNHILETKSMLVSTGALRGTEHIIFVEAWSFEKGFPMQDGIRSGMTPALLFAFMLGTSVRTRGNSSPALEPLG